MAKRPQNDVPAAPVERTRIPARKNPLVWFAGLSALSAAASAYVGFTNREIAKGQAAITRMQYTPQLGLDIEPLRPSETGTQFGTHVRIKNVGSITVYNASV